MEGTYSIEQEYSTQLEKLKRFCTYQERTHKEVKTKAYALGMMSHQIEKALAQLIEEDFLNEGRFSLAWAGGKMRIKKWGRRKIEQELTIKKISPYLINLAMKQYDKGLETDNLRYWMDKKWGTLSGNNPLIKKQKIIQFLLQKGFYYDDINTFLGKYLTEID